MGNLKFECPECEGTTLEEITVNVSVVSIVTDIQLDGYVEYGEQTNEDGCSDHYECKNCGYVITDDEGWRICSAEPMYCFAVKKGWTK